MNSLNDSLHRGAMLFMDYGYPRQEYYHPQRTEGSMLCHYRHRVHADPFLYPGLQDITTSVDFTRVAEVATDTDLNLGGYATQAHFLIGCGLPEIVGENESTTNQDSVELSRQARILTMPGEMGERFKVMALTKNLDIPLVGFQFIDHRSRL
jgi:SAM-dependent MidA family methyltransferase